MDISVTTAKTGRRRYLTLLMIFITVVICYVDRANLAVASATYSGRVWDHQNGDGLYILGICLDVYALPDPRRARA